MQHQFDAIIIGAGGAGMAIGKALQRDALVAITVSMIAIIIYIALRFE